MSDIADGPKGFFRGWVVPILVAILIVALGFTVHFWREGRGLHQIGPEGLVVEQLQDGDIVIRFTPSDDMGSQVTPEKIQDLNVRFKIVN